MSDPLRRYTLALALVPDPDAAGDLFMDAPGEAALRRRAAAWRRRHGLPVIEEPADLPALSEEQQRHALHLAKRGVGRRRLRVGGVIVLAALALLGLVAWVPRSTVATALPAPPEVLAHLRSGTALAGPKKADGLTFAVLAATATDGRIDLWWTVSGLGPFGSDKALQPLLHVAGQERIRPERTERTANVSGKRVRHSIYRVFNATALGAEVRFEPGDVPVLLRTDLKRATGDPEAREVYSDAAEMPQEVQRGVMVKQVLVSSAYTRVQLNLRGNHLDAPVVVQAGEVTLQPLSNVIANAAGEFIYFEPPPEDARSLTVTPAEPNLLGSFVQIELPGEWAGVLIRQEGVLLTLQPAEQAEGTLGLPGYAVVGGGKYGLVAADYLTNDGSPVAVLHRALRVVSGPEGALVEGVVLSWTHSALPQPLEIPLN